MKKQYPKNIVEIIDEPNEELDQMSKPCIPVRMRISRSGSEDGITVKMFREGEVHMMEQSLANAFIAAGVAEREPEEVTDPKDTHEPDNQAVTVESTDATQPGHDEEYNELLEKFQSGHVDVVPEKGKKP